MRGVRGSTASDEGSGYGAFRDLTDFEWWLIQPLLPDKARGKQEEVRGALTQTITKKGDCEEAPLDKLCAGPWAIVARILDDKDETVMETLPPLLEMEPASPGLHDAIADVFRGNDREDEAAGVEIKRKRLFGG